jgi:two-component system chemotaxis response regulator CheY
MRARATDRTEPMAAKILVVDDDESMRELLRMHLAAAGYEVSTAPDAISAGYQVLKNAPDLILSDVSMPHMDGFEFVAALKSDTSLPNIPVIFLTSVEDGEGRGKELGAVGYLTKPVRADRLLEMVAKNVPGGAIPIG